MTTLTEVPVKQITPHPDNIRRDATADPELIASVKEQGILQPLGVIAVGKKYQLIAGHRRLNAAKKAGLDQVPVIVLDHLDTRAKQIEAMLVENGRRQDLSAVEEAAAYEQLTIEGLSATAIAKATGRTAKTVKARLALTVLPDKASEALHSHQITIEQAEKLALLDEDHELQAQVLSAVGTQNLGYELMRAEQRLQNRRAAAQMVEEYEQRGLTEVERPEGGWNHTDGPAPASWFHWANVADADAYWAGGDSTLLIFTKRPERDGAQIDPEEAKRVEERDKERQAEQERRDNLTAAHHLRLTTLAQVFSGLKLNTRQTAVIRAAGSTGDDGLGDVLAIAYGAPWTHRTWADPDAIEQHLATLAPADALGALILSFVSAEIDPTYLHGYGGSGLAPSVLRMFEALELADHPMSDIDRELKQAATDTLAAAEDDEDAA